MPPKFHPRGRATLIGSLPLQDHDAALDLVLAHTPQIPLWVQLPAYYREQMLPQFLPGMPGLRVVNETVRIDTSADDFDDALLAFYEEYLAVTEGGQPLDQSRFVLTPEIAPGFFKLLERAGRLPQTPVALKGQITGPITMGTGVRDQNDRAVFYDDRLRDAMVKLLALKAGWQAQKLLEHAPSALVFIDEPALAGYGSSELISISRDEITACLEEIVAAVHQAGALAGIHVCANTDWGMLLESAVDIINFDAYAYFDNFALYDRQIREFINRGGILAWGIVPTLNSADVDQATVSTLAARWEAMMEKMEGFGFPRADLVSRSLITPSCGTGSLDADRTRKVLELTQSVSDLIRRRVG